jgi:hypothetical protein
MDVLAEVLRRATGARVQDVLLPGFLDHDQGAPRHVSWASQAYLELDRGLLRLTSVGNRGGLELSFVDRVIPPPELEAEDDEFSIASVGPYLIDSPLRITRIRYAMNGESDATRTVVRCAEFELDGRLRLFADPMWVPGIRLTTGDGYDVWQHEERDRERRISGFIEEHAWPPEDS